MCSNIDTLQDDFDYLDLPPTPSSLIESLRDIGYSIETAVADVIDNSITARAKTIDIRFSWNKGTPWLAIVDDGHGMNSEELVSAMRFGSMSPIESRTSDDLGRFGLGLKTASFSQCRSLTVLSKSSGKGTSCCQWDLDAIYSTPEHKWSLRVFPNSMIQNSSVLQTLKSEYLDSKDSGTIVLWERIDRMDTDVTVGKKSSKFNEVMSSVRKHLELVFHRFMVSERGHKKIELSLNKSPLIPFDPFNSTTAHELPSEEFRCEGLPIVVQPYVLPHHSKVTRTEYNKYAGQLGYLHEQGFYVYRNRRLIIKGTWFRLMKKEELTKLLRVKVDIPNALDHLWKIDVKKSNAYPPESIRSELKRIIGKIEFSGKSVYRQRGQRLNSKLQTPAWNRIVANGQIFYEINSGHPLLKQLETTLDETQKSLLSDIVSMLQNSFPRASFFSDVAGTPEDVCPPGIDTELLVSVLEIFIDSWGGSDSVSKEKLQSLLFVDPFAANEQLAKQIFKERGYDC